MKDYGSLTHDDQRRFITHMTHILRRFETLPYEVSLEQVDSDAWSGIRHHWEWVCSQPGFVDWWINGNSASLFNHYVHSFVDQVMQSNGSD